jgi:hypothetical protein
MICNVCNTRRAYTGAKVDTAPPGSQMCNYCFEEGGQENTHSDYNHAGISAQVEAGNGADLSEAEQDELSAMESCWICHPELNLAQKPKAASTGPKAQGDRRPQLNHKGHSHPQTPAARRECKKAFWDIVVHADKVTPEGLQKAMDKWDSHLDGHGKPVPAPKGGWAGVHPKGKTRSVQSTGK